MPEHLLQGGQIGAGVEQVTGVGAAKIVRGDPGRDPTPVRRQGPVGGRRSGTGTAPIFSTSTMTAGASTRFE